jgi:hypothetical protein
MRKEKINPEKMNENKVAVVFDVLLVTSTISAGLYGAGLFLDRFLAISGKEWDLSDSAKAILYFYRGNLSNGKYLLTTSRVG